MRTYKITLEFVDLSKELFEAAGIEWSPGRAQLLFSPGPRLTSVVSISATPQVTPWAKLPSGDGVFRLNFPDEDDKAIEVEKRTDTTDPSDPSLPEDWPST